METDSEEGSQRKESIGIQYESLELRWETISP